MEIHKLIDTFINKGFLLCVTYGFSENDERYAYLMKGKHYNFLNLDDKASEENSYWDVVTNTPFTFDKKLFGTMTYVQWPANVDPSDVASETAQYGFLEKDVEFLNEVCLSILEVKLSLQEHLRKNMVENYLWCNSEELRDRCTMAFYPKKVNITDEDSFKKLQQIVIDEFFTYAKQEVPEQSTYEALSNLGINQKFINCDDPVLVDTLKRHWVRLIEKEKTIFLTHLMSIPENDFMDDEERTEYEEEITELSEMMKNITHSELNEAKTPKDVIQYWPKLLQPVPAFVLTQNNEN